MTLDESFYGWLDFEDHSPNDDSPGPAPRVEVAGRCVRCWAPIEGAGTQDGRWTHVECRLCGHAVDGEEAEQEAKAMLLEMEDNLKPARVGRAPKYRQGARFVLKIMPDIVRSSPQQIARRKKATSATKKRGHRINRHDVPLGDAGYLYLQARVILAGIESLLNEMSAIALTDFDFDIGETQITRLDTRPTGELLRLSAEVPVAHRRPSHREFIARMGRAMVAGLATAFACEVGMKAIQMTRTDEARKTHDLLTLYKALPEDARRRLVADYRAIPDVLERHRHTFDKWRYLERSAGQDGFGALVNTERVRELGKAGRVILDECVTAGLTGDVSVDSTFEVRGRSGQLSSSQHVRLEVKAGEAQVPWEDLLACEDAEDG